MPRDVASQRHAERRYRSIQQGAEYLGVSTVTLRRMIARGEIHGYRVSGKIIRVDLNELDAMLRTIPSATFGGDAA